MTADPIRNPLNIPELLPFIFGNISTVEDLKNIRLVNSLWRDESLTCWRNTAVFLVNDDTRHLISKVHSNSGGIEDDSATSHLFHHLRQKPFKNYRIENTGSSLSYPPISPLIRSFWESCGAHINYLDIGPCLITMKGRQVNGLKWILETCPHLTDLKIAPYIKREDIQFLVLNLNDFKTSSPAKLTSLSIAHFYSQSYHNSAPDGCEPMFSNELSASYSLILFRMLPKLQKLALGNEASAPVIFSTLKDPFTISGIDSNIKKFIQLEKISISGSRNQGSLPFLKEYLEAAKPSLKYLKINIISSSHHQSTVFTLGKCTKDLNTLEAALSVEHIPIVVTTWPHLKQLTLLFSFNKQIDNESLSRLRKLYSHLEILEDKSSSSHHQNESSMAIRNHRHRLQGSMQTMINWFCNSPATYFLIVLSTFVHAVALFRLIYKL